MQKFAQLSISREDLNISKKNFHQHSAKELFVTLTSTCFFFQKAPFWFEIFWYHSLKNIAVDLLPVLKQKPERRQVWKRQLSNARRSTISLRNWSTVAFTAGGFCRVEVVTLFASNRPRLAAAGGVLLRDREHRQQPMAGACWKTGTWFLKFSIWTSPLSQVSVPEVFKFLSCNWRPDILEMCFSSFLMIVKFKLQLVFFLFLGKVTRLKVVKNGYYQNSIHHMFLPWLLSWRSLIIWNTGPGHRMFAKTCGQDQVCTELSQRKSNVSECKLLTFQPEAECTCWS